MFGEELAEDPFLFLKGGIKSEMICDGRHFVFIHHLFECPAAFLNGRVELQRTVGVENMPAPVRNQSFCRKHSSLVVVRGNDRHIFVNVLVNGHNRQLAVLISPQMLVVRPDNQPVDLTGQQILQIALLHFGIVLAVAHQHLIAFPFQALFDFSLQLTEEGVVNGRKDHSDDVGLLLVQLPGYGVRMIVQVLYGLLDLPDRILTQVSATVQDVRDRCLRHAGQSGNVIQFGGFVVLH